METTKKDGCSSAGSNQQAANFGDVKNDQKLEQAGQQVEPKMEVMGETGNQQAFDSELQAYLDGEFDPKDKKAKKAKAKQAKANSKNGTEAGKTAKILAKGKKMSKKKKIIIGVVALVLLLVIVPNLFGSKSTAPMVTTELLQKKDIVSTMSLKGPLSGTESVEVVSRLHSEILSIGVKEGDKVTKGQTLAILDNANVAAEVNQARGSYELAASQYQDKLKDAQVAYAKANQDYKTAKNNYQRLQTVYAEGGISKTDLETSENQLNDAKRQLANYQVSNGKVVGSASDLQQVQITKDALIEKQKAYEDTVIKSPISGTVIRINAAVGRFADDTEDKKPMFIIENIDNLEMKVSVSEYDIAKVQEGQKVKVFADIMGDDFVEAVVARISPTGEVKDNSTERIIPTIIKLTQTNPKLIAGINANADIILGEVKSTFAVPSAAVIQKQDGSFAIATVDANKKVKLIAVTTGIENDVEIEIKPVVAGTLAENLQIITNPTPELVDGMVVTIQPNPEAAPDGETTDSTTTEVVVAS